MGGHRAACAALGYLGREWKFVLYWGRFLAQRPADYHWVRRHLHEFTRLGRLVRIDSSLLLRRFRGKQSMGNRLKPERMVPVGFKRYQRGSVSKRGSKGSQMWYGVCRPGVSYLTSRTVTYHGNETPGYSAATPMRRCKN